MNREIRRVPNLISGSPSRAETQPNAAAAPASYLDLYGLSKPAFNRADNDRAFILFSSHRRLVETLVDHLINGRGLLMLHGEEGAGKSQMLAAAGRLAADAGLRIIKPAPAAAGRIAAPQLLAAILGKGVDGTPGQHDLQGLTRFLQDAPRAVLLIDDFHRLSADCFPILAAIVQQIDLGRFPVVVAGSDMQNQPAQGSLANLAQTQLRIPRLGAAEVRQYIEQSLWIAGTTTRRLIAPDALRLIVTHSDGLPGTVNRLMETTLMAGFARGEPLITARIVAATLAPSVTRRRHTESSRAGLLIHTGAIVLLIIGAATFLYRALDDGYNRPRQPLPAAIEPKAPPAAAEHKLAPHLGAAENLSPELISALMKRGEESFGLGDIAAARLLFQRAAEAGSAKAATAMGRTYDPAFAASGVDTMRATIWYHKAAGMGDASSNDLLKQLLQPAGRQRQ